MNLYTILSFLYGAVGGALACILFFFVAFRKIQSLLSNTVRKKARKHAEFDAVAKEAAVVTPAKVETLCKMVRFDDGIVGEAIQCRMVFYSGTIDIYEVDELRTLPDHRQEVVREHMLGRINRACVTATGERISRYHRHQNKSTRFAAIKGKCTIVRHKDGAPLFLEDPAVLLKERLRALKKEQHQHVMIERMRRRAEKEGTTMTEEEALAKMHDIEAAANKETFLEHLATATGAVSRRRKELLGLGGSEHKDDNSIRYNNNNNGHRKDGKHGGSKRRSSTNSETPPREEVPLSQWSCLAIKFPTRRVQERWLNLLQATPLSNQWHDFLQHLPKMDVFNLLVARLFFENSRANTLHDLLEEKLKKKLERVSQSLPQRLRGHIYLDALDVGGEIPLISNVSDVAASTCGDTEFDFDVLYRGGLSLKIRFAICYREIRVPDIVFSIKVLELAGRMHFTVGPPPTKKFWLGCPRPPQLRLEFAQEVASHDGLLNAVLKLLPDMSEVASNVVRSLLFDDMVFPNLDDFPWPVLGAEDDENSEATHDVSDDNKTQSDIEEYEKIHNDSLVTIKDEEVVVGGPHQLPGHRPEDKALQESQSAPSFTITSTPVAPNKKKGVAVAERASDRNSGSEMEQRSHSMEMPSPPPRPPLPRPVTRNTIDVPIRRASSTGSMPLNSPDGAGISKDNAHPDSGSGGGGGAASLSRTQPPAHTPSRVHSRGGSTASLSTPPPGLPPRAPRAPPSVGGTPREVKVPTSRAPGSGSFRVSHFSDFKEPDEEEEEEEE